MGPRWLAIWLICTGLITGCGNSQNLQSGGVAGQWTAVFTEANREGSNLTCAPAQFSIEQSATELVLGARTFPCTLENGTSFVIHFPELKFAILGEELSKDGYPMGVVRSTGIDLKYSIGNYSDVTRLLILIENGETTYHEFGETADGYVSVDASLSQ